jgi:hypothetical protein
VSTYRIDLLAPEGDLEDWRFVDRQDDDAAIDYARAIDHPHEMRVWDDQRLVAAFAARD